MNLKQHEGFCKQLEANLPSVIDQEFESQHTENALVYLPSRRYFEDAVDLIVECMFNEVVNVTDVLDKVEYQFQRFGFDFQHLVVSPIKKNGEAHLVFGSHFVPYGDKIMMLCVSYKLGNTNALRYSRPDVSIQTVEQDANWLHHVIPQ